jgi:predicted heme/steroid binding protein
VAIDGAVYDVSKSAEWRGGLHRELHWAGQDLSEFLPEAPHGREVLVAYACVGRLADADDGPATSTALGEGE